MKRFIRTAMTVMLAVVAVACSSDEEQPIPESRGTVRVSINGIINGYTPQDATRAIAQNVVRIMWQGGETVYVYEGTKYLGSLEADMGDDKGTYATLSGTIDAPADGNHYLTLVYSPQFSGEPTVSEDGKLSLDLSTQDGKEVPFLIYATMPATEAPEISGASVHFDLATSVYKCNVTGLVAEGSITQAVIGEVNTVCELTLSDTGAPIVSGTTPGNISRTAGFSAADQRAIFSVAVAKTGETAAGRTIEITKGDKVFGAAFDKGSLGTAAAYNTVLVLKEKQAPAGSTGAAMRTGSETPVNWVQLWEGGPKFAVYNVGATSATDYGGYYTWGGSTDKSSSDFNTGSGPLTGDNDTAYKLWGSNWRMPTQAELDALLANCDVEWTTVNNVNGRKFTGKDAYSTNSVFLPAAGNCDYGDVYGQGYSGFYWSSAPDGSNYAYDLLINPSYQGVINDHRRSGESVRAVLEEAAGPAPAPATTGTAKATIGENNVDVNWVQLWADGPKFAEYNVGASSVTETGTTMTFTEATEAGDAYVWGANWCTPSKEDMDELLKAATSTGSEKVTCQYCEYTEGDDKWGFKFTGLTDGYTSNSVFFPAQGGDSSGGSAYYWSGTANDGSTAWDLYLNHGDSDLDTAWYSDYKFNYFPVRPVLKN